MDTEESEFSDISPTESRNGQHGGGPTSGGPWKDTGSYNKKVKVTPKMSELTFSKITSRRTVLIYCISSVVIFVVGLGLGLVIGHFAISKENSDSDKPVSNRSLRSTEIPSEGFASSTTSKTTIPPLPITTPSGSDSTSCECPPSPKSTSSPDYVTTTTRAPGQCRYCQGREPVQTVGNESMTSPFASLTSAEINAALSLLRSRGLVDFSEELHTKRAISIELFLAEKAKVLDYLDKNGVFPGRFAKVHVVRGSLGDIMEYKVGPLNNEEMNITALVREGEIPFNSRPYDRIESIAVQGVVTPHLIAIEKLLDESFDGATHQNGLMRKNIYPLPSLDPQDRTSGVYLYLYGMGIATLTMVPVSFTLHQPGIDTTVWYASDFYYLGQGPFDSGAELQEAYNKGKLRTITFPKGYRDTKSNLYRLQQNASLPSRFNDNIEPPRSYAPSGSRFVIKGSKVMWMGWEFEYASSSLMGPRIYDVRFKGQRIAYEISLQDVTLIYTGQTSGSGPPALSDTVFSLGSYNNPRIGLDCPDRGRILTVSKFRYQKAQEEPSACVFEADGQKPLWRHAQRGLADHHLIVRASMNLGNYDYSMEWRFHLDGSVETLLTASGYLYGAFWDAGDPDVLLTPSENTFTPFGYKISDYLIGPIHDHTYVFKADVDILGTNNSFETVHWRAGSTLDAFKSRYNITEKPGYYLFNYTRYLEPEILENEHGYTSDPYKHKYFTVVNENERNAWGVRRGYRVVPYSTVAENLPSDHPMMDPWGHLRHQVSVTRRRESEQHATSSWYDLQLPVRSRGGLDKMLNNETIRNSDIVLWIVEKFLHAPTSEDLPITLNVVTGFKLQPYNYFDRTPTFDIPAHYNSGTEPYPLNEPCYENSP